MCEWPVLVMPWSTARSNAASAVYSTQVWWSLHWVLRPGWADGLLQGLRLPVCGDFPEEEAALGNHRAQSPAKARVASPGNIIGHCKVKCSLCSAQKVWWSLNRGCGRPGQVVCGVSGFAAGLWRFPEEEAALRNHSAQSSATV